MGTAEWSARQYLKFEDERTRPARDLLAQVPLTEVRRAVDLGCGPGNSTELLIARYPTAVVSGLDSSEDMLRQARKRLPNCAFVEGDLASWTPARAPGDEPVDLLFANAAYQWVPDHLKAMCRVVEALGTGSVLAVQMPDNTREPSHLAMEDVARRFGVPEKRTTNALCALGKGARPDLPPVDAYYDALRPLCSRLDIWHTIYNHPMADTAAIAEWFRGSALRPFLARLDAQRAQEFVPAYIDEIGSHYKARADGQVLLRFPRLFMVATR
ncbi:MAG TPA: trans-aconitate 2-methyltransferase [Bryobacteraceae bacterium]